MMVARAMTEAMCPTPGSQLPLAQVANHILSTGLMPNVETAADAPPALLCGGFGELQVQSG
jgi:hypothetical protein